MTTPATYSGYEGMGYQIYIGVFFLGLWSFLLFVSLALSFTGIYRKYCGGIWLPFFAAGLFLFFLLISLTFVDGKLYLELSGKGLFAIFLRSIILLLPVALISFGSFLMFDSPTRLPGACFIVAGIMGALSCLPFIAEPALRLLDLDSPETGRLLKLSYLYLQQLSLLRILAETIGIIGIFSYLKHKKEEGVKRPPPFSGPERH